MVNIVYGVFLIWFYIIQDRKVCYEGGFGLMGYNMSEVKMWLEKYWVEK